MPAFDISGDLEGARISAIEALRTNDGEKKDSSLLSLTKVDQQIVQSIAESQSDWDAWTTISSEPESQKNSSNSEDPDTNTTLTEHSDINHTPYPYKDKATNQADLYNNLSLNSFNDRKTPVISVASITETSPAKQNGTNPIVASNKAALNQTDLYNNLSLNSFNDRKTPVISVASITETSPAKQNGTNPIVASNKAALNQTDLYNNLSLNSFNDRKTPVISVASITETSPAKQNGTNPIVASNKAALNQTDLYNNLSLNSFNDRKTPYVPTTPTVAYNSPYNQQANSQLDVSSSSTTQNPTTVIADSSSTKQTDTSTTTSSGKTSTNDSAITKADTAKEKSQAISDDQKTNVATSDSSGADSASTSSPTQTVDKAITSTSANQIAVAKNQGDAATSAQSANIPLAAATSQNTADSNTPAGAKDTSKALTDAAAPVIISPQELARANSELQANRLLSESTLTNKEPLLSESAIANKNPLLPESTLTNNNPLLPENASINKNSLLPESALANKSPIAFGYLPNLQEQAVGLNNFLASNKGAGGAEAGVSNQSILQSLGWARNSMPGEFFFLTNSTGMSVAENGAQTANGALRVNNSPDAIGYTVSRASIDQGFGMQAASSFQAVLNNTQNIQTVARATEGLLAALQQGQGATSAAIGEGKISTIRAAGALMPESMTGSLAGQKGAASLIEGMGASLPVTGIPTIKGAKGEATTDGSDITLAGKVPGASSINPIATSLPVSTTSTQTTANTDPNAQNTATSTAQTKGIKDPDATDLKSLIDAALPSMEITGLKENTSRKDPLGSFVDVDNQPSTGSTSNSGSSSLISNLAIDGKRGSPIAGLSMFDYAGQSAKIASIFVLALWQFAKNDKTISQTLLHIKLKRMPGYTEHKKYVVQVGETFGKITKDNYVDARFAVGLYLANMNKSLTSGKGLPQIQNLDDIEAIQNIRPKPGTVLILPSSSDLRYFEIAQKGEFNKYKQKENLKTLKKGKFRLNDLIPNWIKENPGLIDAFGKIFAQLFSLKDRAAVKNTCKAMAMHLVQQGYISRRGTYSQSLSSTAREFKLRGPEEAFAY